MKKPVSTKKKAGRSDKNLRELSYHVGLMKDITLYFSTAAMTNSSVCTNRRLKAHLVADLRELVIDTDPDRTLRETALNPVPFDRLGLGRGPIWPREKWSRMVKSSVNWPHHVRKAAAPLLNRKEKFPDWKSLQEFIANIGLTAVPILGYVGGQVYVEMLARREVPICTYWVKRYRVAPSGIVSPDTSHDIGHGLAMASTDYREMCIDYCEAAIKWPKYANSGRIYDDYVRFFELAFVSDEKGVVSPIGADSFGLDAFDLVGTVVRTKSRQSDEGSIYRFATREHWQRETEKFIRSIVDRKIRHLTLPPSERLALF